MLLVAFWIHNKPKLIEDESLTSIIEDTLRNWLQNHTKHIGFKYKNETKATFFWTDNDLKHLIYVVGNFLIHVNIAVNVKHLLTGDTWIVTCLRYCPLMTMTFVLPWFSFIWKEVVYWLQKNQALWPLYIYIYQS